MIARSLLAAALLFAAVLPAAAETPATQEACYALIDPLTDEFENKTFDAKTRKDFGALLQKLMASCGSNQLAEAGNTIGQLRAIIAKLPN